MQKTIIAIALFTILIAACYREKDFSKKELNPDNIITGLTAGRNTLLATGTDTTQITIELPIDASDSGSAVSFTTNSGLFLPAGKNEIQLKASLIIENGTKKKVARLIYQAPAAPGTADITAKIASVSKSLSITVNRNYADSIDIVPSALSLTADPFSEMSFIVNFYSKAGKVTPGQPVSFSIKDTIGNDRGTFRIRNEKSNDAGQASFVYSIMPDTAYRGRLYVRSETVSNNIPHPDSTIIYIIKK